MEKRKSFTNKKAILITGGGYAHHDWQKVEVTSISEDGRSAMILSVSSNADGDPVYTREKVDTRKLVPRPSWNVVKELCEDEARYEEEITHRWKAIPRWQPEYEETPTEA